MDIATIEYNFYRKFNFSAACEPRLDIAQRFSSRTQQYSAGQDISNYSGKIRNGIVKIV